MPTTEYEDKLAVEVRHRGPCPFPKGHAAGDVWTTVWMTALVMFVGTSILLGWLSETPELRKQAVALGCAAYDQKDGRWHWVQK